MEGIDALFELAMDGLLKENQTALQGLSNNFPIPGIGPLMRAICFPTGLPYTGTHFIYISAPAFPVLGNQPISITW